MEQNGAGLFYLSDLKKTQKPEFNQYLSIWSIGIEWQLREDTKLIQIYNEGQKEKTKRDQAKSVRLLR